MDAVEFLREKHRMCITYSTCDNCRLRGSCYGEEVVGIEEDVVEIVEEWSKEHPVKTRQSEFLKLFPDADISTGHVNVCPNSLYKETCTCSKYPTCISCKREFWLQEVE